MKRLFQKEIQMYQSFRNVFHPAGHSVLQIFMSTSIIYYYNLTMCSVFIITNLMTFFCYLTINATPIAQWRAAFMTNNCENEQCHTCVFKKSLVPSSSSLPPAASTYAHTVFAAPRTKTTHNTRYLQPETGLCTVLVFGQEGCCARGLEECYLGSCMLLASSEQSRSRA